MLSPLESFKSWLVWAHDPCEDGGWRIDSQHDTRDEALTAAKDLDARREKQFRETVAHFSKTRSSQPWLRSDECYDGCMVTPGPVNMIRVGDAAEVKEWGLYGPLEPLKPGQIRCDAGDFDC